MQVHSSRAHPVLFIFILLERLSCEAQSLLRLPPKRNDEMELERDDVRDPRLSDVGTCTSIRELIGNGFLELAADRSSIAGSAESVLV